jgi:hypothetical protein
MIEGIEYYPKKSKIRLKSIIFAFAFIVLIISVYFLSQSSSTTTKASNNNQTLIVIKKAQGAIKNTVNIIKYDTNYEPEVDNQAKSYRKLDEIIQAFEQE